MTHLSITKNKLLFMSIGVIICFLIGFIFYNKPNEAVETQHVSIQAHDTKRFFDKYLFQKGIIESEQKHEGSYKIKGKILGAIVPHHQIPSFIIADIFERLAAQDVKTIILLSPNHYDIGVTSILTSELNWDTPQGTVLSDGGIIRNLLQKDYISVDEDIMDNEHGIAGLLPFIKYYNDSTKIVPLILRQSMTREQIDDLSKTIARRVDANTVVVASVDFSHYLISEEAEKNDKEIKKAMENNEINKILNMNSDYLDSPEAIAILLQSMNHVGANSMNILHNTNSAKLMDKSYGETTSYFGVVFTE